MRGVLSVYTLLFLVSFSHGGGPSEKVEIKNRVYNTDRIEGQPPTIDGQLTDPVWETVEWSGEFVQREPVEGPPPSFQTRFKVLYDNDALYLAFRVYDDPENMDNKMDRHDHFPGDWVEINIDSYGDQRTAFSFTLSLSETRGDELISEDGNNWDSSWDPIWRGATKVDDKGWTAEMRIPLSQLRFSADEKQVWGLQVTRRMFRLEERSTWQRIPKDTTGWVSQFGELRGLNHIKPKRRLELLPYMVGGGKRAEASAGDPFFDGSDDLLDGGLDGKYGITNNLTLDFTINPDFGQVEADPSEVNLSSFETFFEERRPFFIEGRNIFNVPVAPAETGGPFAQDNMFYSRRIGRRPSLRPRADYVDQPEGTGIIGAFKLSGKTANGLSIGILESVTAEETAGFERGGERGRQTVEPLSNYFVGRIQKDLQNGDTQIGGVVTAVNRDLKDPRLDFLTEQAYGFGVDFSTYFRNRNYRLQGSLMSSSLRGSENAIGRIQTAPARYYQRPDNGSERFDPTRTSLRGQAGSLRFSRTNNFDIRFQTGLAWRSPGFEINDLGFMRNADQINQFTWVGWRKEEPFSVFDNMRVNANQWLDWDNAGNFLGASANVNAHAQFRNKGNSRFSITRNWEATSNTELRGGPSMLLPGRWSIDGSVSSDQRRNFVVTSGFNARRGDSGSLSHQSYWMELRFRPTNAMRLSFNPQYASYRPEMQYVATQDFTGEPRFLFAELDQETTSFTLRLDYAITPRLTIQYYGAPFVSTGRYSAFKRITDPTAHRYSDRFVPFSTEQITLENNGAYAVDENNDGATDYRLGNPDFDFRELSSNLVIRWEYSPGSLLFLVWSQNRFNGTLLGEGLDHRDQLDTLFSTHPENVVLLKISKWWAP